MSSMINPLNCQDRLLAIYMRCEISNAPLYWQQMVW